MSKRLIMICAAVLAVAFAMPAYAAVQNVKVGGDLNMLAISRDKFALGNTYTDIDDNQGILASIVRVRLDAELTDNVSAVVRLLNERTWDQEAAATNDIELDLAYVVLKEFLYSPLTLTAGRQELHFGNDLIIGDYDGNSVSQIGLGTAATAGTLADFGDLSARKAFDALRGTLDYTFADQPLTVDLVYSKIDENISNSVDDVNLYGVNANYVVNDDLVSEVYFWLREREPDATGNTTAALDGSGQIQGLQTEDLRTLGLRTVYTGIDNLTLQGEGAYQSGTRVWSAALNADQAQNPNRLLDSYLSVEAWALQLIGSYVLEDVRHDPVLGASYTHLSGDKLNDSGNYRGWDSMFENQSGGTIWNKIVGFSNCDLVNVNGTIKPDFVDDVTIVANWYHIRLDEPVGLANIAGGTTATLSGVAGGQTYLMTNDEHLGDEIDVDLNYDYTEDVQLGLGLGWFIPGDAFNTANDSVATQVIASMKVTF